MPARHISLRTGQYLLVALLSAISIVLPAGAQTTNDNAPENAPVRVKITLGPRDGAARPTRHGQKYRVLNSEHGTGYSLSSPPPTMLSASTIRRRVVSPPIRARETRAFIWAKV